ncbi:MAG: HNH endonuclease [Spirochaetaceae bacterium]|jgi:5-methylcytosine-specific restriction protein A|nr:HNH endonuclease [Spirochaetaceae bacterium]
MQDITISRDRVVFINLTEMDEYNGLEANLKGGGAFIDQNGYGYEVYNFKNDGGKCYGYTPPHSKIKLSRISNVISHDALGDYIDDALVVFTCSRNQCGRLVCGFYQRARIYAEPVTDSRSTRVIDIDGQSIFVAYNIICDADDAILINRKDRSQILPRSSGKNDAGHGHHQLWYADKPKCQRLKNEMLDYVEYLINQAHACDEFKYHLHNESQVSIMSTKQINRSQKAKAECIALKGCHCNICGFDFEKTYGELGKEYIEVHHITPIGVLSTAEGYEGTDPERDLIPLCSNCHSMIHRRKVPYQPDEIKALIVR